LLRRFVREYYDKPLTTAVISMQDVNASREGEAPLSRSQTQDTRIGASFALPAQFKIDER
jgi:hypothetical protein